jgi:hypothetical protein
MPGLVPGIHVLAHSQQPDVDGRDKPGHDEEYLMRHDALYSRTFNSSGTAASYLELCSTSEVLTLRTWGAAVRCVTKS